MLEQKEIWIFLSHSSDDFDKVRKIRNYLEEKLAISEQRPPENR